VQHSLSPMDADRGGDGTSMELKFRRHSRRQTIQPCAGARAAWLPCRPASPWCALSFTLAGNRHQHFALARCRLLRLTALGRLRGAALADIVQTLAQRIHRVDYVSGIARFHGRARRLAFSLFVQQLDGRVFVAVFKFARFDRLQPEEMLRCKPKFSVAVAAVAVAAVTAVAAAAVAAVAAVAVIVTVIGGSRSAVKGAGA